MSNLYQMMCKTGNLPTPIKRKENARSSPKTARQSDDDPDSVASPNSSNRASIRRPLHEEPPLQSAHTVSAVREIVWNPPPTTKEFESNAGDDIFASVGSSGTFEQRYNLQLEDCKVEEDDLSVISDPRMMFQQVNSARGVPKKTESPLPVESESTQSITSSEYSSELSESDASRRNRIMDDFSVYTENDDSVYADDCDTEVSPEFNQCFAQSMNLTDSDSFDIMSQASGDACNTVCDATVVDDEAFGGDLWHQMHDKAPTPEASPDTRKQSKYNRYKDMQTPTSGAARPEKRFQKFKDITPEGKTQSMYEKLDQRVQQLLLGDRDDIDTLQHHLDALKLSTSPPRGTPPPRMESFGNMYMDAPATSTKQPVFIKRCPTLDEVMKQEKRHLASSARARPSTSVYYPKIDED